jgi:glycosyltransferase involved in cell wall biosynthesis
MNLVVNGRFLSRRVTGVERYGREIMRRLPGSPRVVQPVQGAQGTGGHAWEQFILPGKIRRGEILWSPANTGPLAVSRHALTLHDLSPLEHPEWFNPAFALWYRLFLPGLVQRVRRIIVPSEDVRRKTLLRFSLPPEKVSVIHGGVDLNHFNPQRRPPLQVPTRYVLFVGSLQPRKNLGVLLQAWGQVLPHFSDVRLLVAGAGDRNFRSGAPRAAQTPALPERVRFLGYVPESVLPGLYAHALALVCPSLDEGFGLPVLEGMACGAPVIAARAGALPEVTGEAGLLFDPTRPADLAEALARCLEDACLRRTLIETGLAHVRSFSWQRSAGRLWDILQSCTL